VQAGVDHHRLFFDCSTDEAYKRSYESTLVVQSPIEQESLKVAVLELMMNAVKDVDPPRRDFEDLAIEKISQRIDGKSAAEVIELAAQMRSK